MITVEEYAYILDYLPQGLPSGSFGKKEPLCYAVGETEFKLFELVPKVRVEVEERVYIGKDGSLRTKIDHVKRRINNTELSRSADIELEYAVNTIVLAHESRFIKFYNEAEAISMRKHLLEELPGLGKKTMQAILDERTRNGAFKNFKDLSARVPSVKAPEKLIRDRIVLEIRDADRKRYLFVSR